MNDDIPKVGDLSEQEAQEHMNELLEDMHLAYMDWDANRLQYLLSAFMFGILIGLIVGLSI